MAGEKNCSRAGGRAGEMREDAGGGSANIMARGGALTGISSAVRTYKN